jgi:hypothetical protein
VTARRRLSTTLVVAWILTGPVGCQGDRACPAFRPACVSSQAEADQQNQGCSPYCPCAVYCPASEAAVRDAAAAGDVQLFGDGTIADAPGDGGHE